MAQLAPRNTDWSEDELIISIYLYRFGWEDLGVSYGDIAALMGRRASTIPFRFANFLSYDGIETGLKHGGRYAREIYQRYKGIPREELRRRAVQALLTLSRSPASTSMTQEE